MSTYRELKTLCFTYSITFVIAYTCKDIVKMDLEEQQRHCLPLNTPILPLWASKKSSTAGQPVLNKQQQKNNDEQLHYAG